MTRPRAILLPSKSEMRMSPSKIESSERNRMMAAPEVQMKRECCCSNQNLKHRRAGLDERRRG